MPCRIPEASTGYARLIQLLLHSLGQLTQASTGLSRHASLLVCSCFMQSVAVVMVGHMAMLSVMVLAMDMSVGLTVITEAVMEAVMGAVMGLATALPMGWHTAMNVDPIVITEADPLLESDTAMAVK
mmetsp:Transcript_54930/g.100356  ORF Transcript_54930/g.100356 Transcript_54930/m.100356 type:complete len:127 (+) Transcript_54930:178-558(+)